MNSSGALTSSFSPCFILNFPTSAPFGGGPDRWQRTYHELVEAVQIKMGCTKKIRIVYGYLEQYMSGEINE